MSGVLLLGNGFNYSVLSFLRNKNANEDLIQFTKEICYLWNRFDDIFREIQANFSFSTSEECIEFIYYFLDLIRTIRPPSNVRARNFIDCLNVIRNFIENSVLYSLYDIIIRFMRLETEDFYTRIARFLVEQNSILEDLIKNLSINIFTTNYDGIGEIVFCYNPQRRPREKIQCPDLFSKSACLMDGNIYRYVCFDPLVKHENCLLHLHGSYKFFVHDNRSIKFIRDGCLWFKQQVETGVHMWEEYTPIIVYNAPSLKRKIISRFDILSVYFQIFLDSLEKSEYLIIWGQSLRNDPHILNELQRFLRRFRKIIVIDVNHESVINTLFSEIDYRVKEDIIVKINPESFDSLRDIFIQIQQIMQT